MTIRFVRRVAAELKGRGEGAIRINSSALEDVKKAITRDDVRRLIENGSVYVIKEKRNISMNAKKLKIRRSKGRGRGPGKRKGTLKARGGYMWKKKARSQRMLLKRLKVAGKIDRQTFNKYYRLIKGNSFADKGSMLLHLREEGIQIEGQTLKEINDYIKNQYK